MIMLNQRGLEGLLGVCPSECWCLVCSFISHRSARNITLRVAASLLSSVVSSFRCGTRSCAFCKAGTEARIISNRSVSAAKATENSVFVLNWKTNWFGSENGYSLPSFSVRDVQISFRSQKVSHIGLGFVDSYGSPLRL